MARKRDYQSEYRRRIERAEARGLSRSQARGHAKAGERALRAPQNPELARARLEAAIRILRTKGNAQRAAAEAKVSAERFRRFLRDEALANRDRRAWVITDNRTRTIKAITTHGDVVFEVLGFDAASLAYRHRLAVKQYLVTNNKAFLLPFVGAFVPDVTGKAHFLETRPNALYRLSHQGGDGFEDVYRIANPT